MSIDIKGFKDYVSPALCCTHFSTTGSINY